MVTYNVKDDDSFDVYRQEGAKVRLGEGMDEKGKLGNKPMLRAIETLKLFKEISQLEPIKSVLPLATSAVREASNKDEFLNEVYRETGFRFKVLSEREEALYSYVGAIKSLQIPNALFFDIGGGSIEIVHAEKFKIRKVISLPLGALRLTQQFDGEDGSFNQKNCRNMRRYVWDLLPDKKELDLSPDTRLVGVGGALRALARYDQKITKYPLDEIHNYKITSQSVSAIARRLTKMNANEISNMPVIGSGRAQTMVAGSCVINSIMQKFGFNNLWVSNHGLREGALSIFLENPRAYHSKNITAEQIRDTIRIEKPFKIFPNSEDFINSLSSSKLISKREYQIFSFAEKKILEKLSYNNPQSLFYSIMDEDMSLNHADQLVLGLSLVHTRHVKTADWLFSRYKSILSAEDKIAIKKISSLITLLSVLDRTKSKIELKKFTAGIVEFNIIQSRLLPKLLLRNALSKFGTAFDVHVICMLRSDEQSIRSSVLEL